MSRMAALVALPVSLAELLEVRGRQGLTSRELRAVAAQTCRHLATLLETDGHVAAVPLKHITAQTLQLTGSGQVRLSHTELYSDVYSVTAGDIQPVLRSLGEVLLTAAAESVPEDLTSVLTNLRDGLVTLQQLPQLLTEQAASEPGPVGRPHHEVVALLHEELLGMSDSLSPRSPPRSPSQLELTLNPSLHETAIFTEIGRAGPLLPSDSGSISHAGSFPEVSLRRRSLSPPHREGEGEGEEVEVEVEVEESKVETEVEDSKISTSTELRNASCVVSGHYPGRRSPETHRLLGRKSATSGSTSAGSGGHRHDILLEKDMIRLMARESTSAENLATSTPNQSLVAPSGGAMVAQPHGTLRRRRPVRRKPSALYGPRPGRPEPGERVFCGPEFVIRAREKPRRIDLTQKSSVSGCVLVILLNGQKLEIGCQPDTHTVADVTKAVFEEEPYPHPSLLGLAVSADGEFLFPPPATRLNKALVSPAGGRQLTLYQRFKLYPTADTLPKSATGLHLLYLQLRQNLLENSLDVSSNQVVQLSSLALLAEFGDRSDKSCADSMMEDGGAAYFLPEHYLPEPLTSQAELLRQLTEGHVTCGSEQPAAAGQAGGPAAAERRFVRVAAGCRGYGRHRCSVDLRVKSYSTSTLSIDPSCLRLSRCDPSGRSTTRTLHWSTVSKIEYKHRSRRLIVNTAGAEAMTFCGEKAKLRCLEYMLQQHLTSFREGLHLTAGSGQPTQVYRARADPTSPQLTHYCVRTPLSSLTNRAATRHAVAANQKAASPDLKAAPVSTANQKPAPAGSANGRTPAARRTNENAGSSPELTNQLEESPAAANRRRRSAGGPLRQRQVSRGAARWRSASQLAQGRPAAAARDGSPPANGIRMGTRVPVSALQRQKLRSREALPHLTDGAYVIAAEVPATPDLTAQCGTRPVDGSTGDLRHTAGVFNITLHRCPRTGDLGVRVVRAAAAADGGLLTVETVTAAGPAGTRALIAGGDVITHISGCPLRPLSYSAAVDRLRRAVDPVTLTVIRRGDGGAASWTDSGAAKRPADEDAGDGDDVSRGSLEKRLCRDGPGRESVNDLVIGRLTRQLSGDCLATPEGKR